VLIYIIFIVTNVDDNEKKANPFIQFNINCPAVKILLGNRCKTCRTDQAIWLKKQSGGLFLRYPIHILAKVLTLFLYFSPVRPGKSPDIMYNVTTSACGYYKCNTADIRTHPTAPKFRP
jgi:hypothetical protein